MEERFGVDMTLDIRGQVCPLTFVRAKLAMEGLTPGAVLEIIVDHEPAALNVPRSLEREGHRVLGVGQTGTGEWCLFVEKGHRRREG